MDWFLYIAGVVLVLTSAKYLFVEEAKAIDKLVIALSWPVWAAVLAALAGLVAVAERALKEDEERATPT
jgi:hypothetical protein